MLAVEKKASYTINSFLSASKCMKVVTKMRWPINKSTYFRFLSLSLISARAGIAFLYLSLRVEQKQLYFLIGASLDNRTASNNQILFWPAARQVTVFSFSCKKFTFQTTTTTTTTHGRHYYYYYYCYRRGQGYFFATKVINPAVSKF